MKAGGEARLRTVEGGVLAARMKRTHTNITLTDERGNVADIAIYDIHDRNGVIQGHRSHDGGRPARRAKSPPVRHFLFHRASCGDQAASFQQWGDAGIAAAEIAIGPAQNRGCRRTNR